jgi:excisionase family DNA binding protein
MEDIQIQLDRIERNTLLAAKKVLTFEDVALITGLSRSYLYKLTSANQIPHYKPSGKQLYFDREEIENWLKRNKIETEDETDRKATNYVVTGRRQMI